jgi:MFS family permease
MNYVFYLFFNWFFYYLVEVRGFAAERAAALSAAQWVIGAVGAAAGGLACDARMRRDGLRRGARVVPVAGLVAAGLLLLAGSWVSQPLVAVALLAACFGCIQLTDAAYWAATIAVADRHAASATGVLNTGGNLVGFAGALAVPVIARWLGWPWAIASGAVAALVGAALWLWIRADRRLELPESADERVSFGRRPVRPAGGRRDGPWPTALDRCTTTDTSTPTPTPTRGATTARVKPRLPPRHRRGPAWCGPARCTPRWSARPRGAARSAAWRSSPGTSARTRVRAPSTGT